MLCLASPQNLQSSESAWLEASRQATHLAQRYWGDKSLEALLKKSRAMGGSRTASLVKTSMSGPAVNLVNYAQRGLTPSPWWLAYSTMGIQERKCNLNTFELVLSHVIVKLGRY